MIYMKAKYLLGKFTRVSLPRFSIIKMFIVVAFFERSFWPGKSEETGLISYLKFSGSVLDSLANFLIKVAVLTQSPLKKRDRVQPNLHPHQQLFLGPF